MRNNTFRLVLAAVALSAWVPVLSFAADEAVYEPAAVKAAFIYHFATFVKWPDPIPAGNPFTIAVLGDDIVAQELKQFLPGRHILDRPMEVRQIASVAELDHAEVLFIGADREADIGQLTETLGDQPVLVVADAPGALDRGAMINFAIMDNRLRFEVSLRAAERVGLSLSSRLLAAALEVHTSGVFSNRYPMFAVVYFQRAKHVGLQQNGGTGGYRAAFESSGLSHSRESNRSKRRVNGYLPLPSK